MNTSPYRLLRFECKNRRVVCVPWPQLLAWRWSPGGEEDQITFRLSLGTIRVIGRKLNPLWSAVVSQQADRLAEGRRDEEGVIRVIEFDFADDEVS
jgi:hypothetical protein